MAEPVRLVIWDLDETFWAGTLTEGGIAKYVQAHHDTVVELARRGIMNSICSKNDFAVVQAILREHTIWDYFVFPSIDWSPKAERIASIIDATQLRSASVLFIDDNAMNRAEASAHVPGLQVAAPDCLATLLSSALCQGKDDRALARLAQYKLLERRRSDFVRAGADNPDFLRRSNIKVSINADVDGNIDRAVELVSRTNQLNFTKARLPNDPASARAQLRAEMSPFYMTAGLVRVTDSYGDYGYCGFYCTSPDQIVHYCFSCRILGMGIETWLYDRLGRPEIEVVGDVLTDLAKHSAIDWITFVDFGLGEALRNTSSDHIGEVRIRGGCELDAVAHYLRLHTDRLLSETNHRRGAFFIRCDCTALLLNSVAPPSPPIQQELQDIGYISQDFITGFFAPASPGTVLVCSAWADVYGGLYRHRESGVRLPVDIPGLWGDFTTLAPEAIAAAAEDQRLDASERGRVLRAVAVLRERYEYVGKPTPADIVLAVKTLCGLIPDGAVLLLILPFEKCRYDNKIQTKEDAIAYNQLIRNVVGRMKNVKLVDINVAIHSDDELQGEFDHFDRIVYFRVFEMIMKSLRTNSTAAS
ncbi:MAG: HAD-IIIC family phosphatase [Steroidobacteraceae bacterium]